MRQKKKPVNIPLPFAPEDPGKAPKVPGKSEDLGKAPKAPGKAPGEWADNLPAPTSDEEQQGEEPPENPPGPNPSGIAILDESSAIGDIIVHRAPATTLRDLLERIERKELSVKAAAIISGYSHRQFCRKLSDYRGSGEPGLAHKALGKPSNHKLPQALVDEVVETLESWPPGGTPSLLNEFLKDKKGVFISDETLRQIMIRNGFWSPGERKLLHRSRRPRKPCFGQMLQMDTSEHDWLGEGRSTCLIATVDDATGRLFCRLYEADTTLTNMDLLRRYALKFGLPMSLYVDRASIFSINPRDVHAAKSKYDMTQFERACQELDIEVIHACSPEAKGRVERKFGTLQKHLPFHFQMSQIRSVGAANEYIDNVYLDRHNSKYGKAPLYAMDWHRTAKDLNLDGVLSIQHDRTVNKDHTFKFGGGKYQLHMRQGYPDLAGKKVKVEIRIDGAMKANYKGLYINFSPIK